jgi:hypothetical protein
MIVEQKFDDCENHGLQHAWGLFKFSYADYGGNGATIAGNYPGPVEVPVTNEPIPFLKKLTTYSRKCKNCLREELFETESVGKWVRK